MDPTPTMSIAYSSTSSEEGWQDIEPDGEDVLVVSLFDDTTFSDARSMLDYCRDQYGFDFLETRRRLGLDFLGAVKLCNFVRGCVRSKQQLPDIISHQHIESDDLLKPALDDDGLIIQLGELLEELVEAPSDHPHPSVDGLAQRNKLLEEELGQLQEQFQSYRLTVAETLDRRWGSDIAPPSEDIRRNARRQRQDTVDTDYWESYAGRDIHETMLKDAVRTDAYRDFVYGNKDLFSGKVILDIGCGTGILSMFCARAGAKQVIAVDNSTIIEKARQNVVDNELSDVITLISGRIEDVVLPVAEVDVIISEWMGYCLLYEAMLPSVLWARDKYLKPDGLLVPSVATIWAAPVSDDDYITDNVSFWDDVYGFKMKAMQEGMFDEAIVQTLPPTSLCGEPFVLAELQLHEVKVEELNFTKQWTSQFSRDVERLDGFLIWFDIFFTRSQYDPTTSLSSSAKAWKSSDEARVAFTTGPDGIETHWKQGLLLMPPVGYESNIEAGARIVGETKFAALATDSRALSIEASWTISSRNPQSRIWRLQ